jgi:hypothetical protein
MSSTFPPYVFGSMPYVNNRAFILLTYMYIQYCRNMLCTMWDSFNKKKYMCFTHRPWGILTSRIIIVIVIKDTPLNLKKKILHLEKPPFFKPGHAICANVFQWHSMHIFVIPDMSKIKIPTKFPAIPSRSHHFARLAHHHTLYLYI